jgi:hypothetical protein
MPLVDTSLDFTPSSLDAVDAVLSFLAQVFKGAKTTYNIQNSPHSCQPSKADRKEHNDMTSLNVMDETGAVFTYTHLV